MSRHGAGVRRQASLRTRLWTVYFRLWVLPWAPLVRTWHRWRVGRACPEMRPFFARLDAQLGALSATERSYLERTERGLLADASLTYGELSWPSFMDLLNRASPCAGETFVELGCGHGQFCFYASRRHGMNSVGMERVASLVAVAQELAAQDPPPRASFHNMDFLDGDFAKGSIFYMTGACMGPAQRALLVEKLRTCASGARLISVGRPLQADFLQLLHQRPVTASWGHDTAWVYLRR